MVLDKPEMPVNTPMEIWNRLKYKRSSPQTQRSCRMELVSETLALCEMSKEMKTELSKNPEKKTAGSSLPRRIMGKSCCALCSLTSEDQGGKGRDTLTEFASTRPAAWHTGLRLKSLEDRF